MVLVLRAFLFAVNSPSPELVDWEDICVGEPSCVPFGGGNGGGWQSSARPLLLGAGFLEPQLQGGGW